MVKRAGKSDETKAVTPASKAKGTKISNENIKKGLAAYLKEKILSGANPISSIHGRIAENLRMHERLLTAEPDEAQERLENADRARKQLSGKLEEVKAGFKALINAIGADETKYLLYKNEGIGASDILIIKNEALKTTVLGQDADPTAETTEIPSEDLLKIVDSSKLKTLKTLIGRFKDEILAATEEKRLDTRFGERVEKALKKLLEIK